MSKGIQKPSSHDLINDLRAIWEIKERLHEIDIIRLKELVIQLDKMLYDKFRFINDFLILNPSYSLEDRKKNTWQYGFNYNMLEKLKDLIQNRINFISEKQNNIFNDIVFKDVPSETFFNYMVENWLKEEPNKVTALRFVFSEMWYKTLEKETPYKIISSQPYFAREYWNKNYSNLLELHPKNPKLKKDNFTDYYHNRFAYFLTEFQGG